MAKQTPHDRAANRVAKKFGVQYNKGPGADIQTKKLAGEVETPRTVKDASRQLQGHKKPVYIIGSNNEAVEKALKTTKNNTIGVMDSSGKIIKPSTRG